MTPLPAGTGSPSSILITVETNVSRLLSEYTESPTEQGAAVYTVTSSFPSLYDQTR